MNVAYRRQRHDSNDNENDQVSLPMKEVEVNDQSRGFNFIRSTLNPFAFGQAAMPLLATDLSATVFPVEITMSSTYQNASGTYRVGDGLIITYPLIAYDAHFHFAIRKQGQSVGWAAGQPTGIDGVIATLNFGADLAIPYNGDAFAIAFGSVVGAQFDQCRVFSGGYKFESTTSTNGISLTGSLFAAVVTSTPDICQTGGKAYPTAGLLQSSRTTKDTVRNVKASEGVVVVIGDNLKTHFTRPEPWYVDGGESASIATVYADTTPHSWLSGDVGGTTLGHYSNVFGLEGYWISPWTTTVSYSAAAGAFTTFLPTGSGAAWQVLQNVGIQTDKIGECDALVIQMDSDYQFSYGSTGGDSVVSVRVYASAVHVFMSTSETGVDTMRFVKEVFDLNAPDSFDWNSTVTYLDGTNCTSSVRFGVNDIFSRGKLTAIDENGVTVGKYMGTMIYTAAAFGSIAGANSGINFTISRNNITFKARPLHGAEANYDGPAIITRYEDISPLQGISLEGVSNLQAVAKSTLNQVLKLGDAEMHLPANYNVLTLVKSLYMAGDLPLWKCVWEKNEWTAVNNKLLDQGPANFMADITRLVGPGHITMAQSAAAGFFGNLGRAIGGVAQGLGAGLDAFSGAAGQFGMNRSRGQFGMNQSRGQFGM